MRPVTLSRRSSGMASQPIGASASSPSSSPWSRAVRSTDSISRRSRKGARGSSPPTNRGRALAGRRRADRIEAPELDPPRPAGPTIGAVRSVDHQVELRLDRHETDVIRRPAVANEDGRTAHLVGPLDELDEQRRPFDGGGVRRECPGVRRPECGRFDEHDIRLGSLERQEGVIRGDAIDDGVRREGTGGGSLRIPSTTGLVRAEMATPRCSRKMRSPARPGLVSVTITDAHA